MTGEETPPEGEEGDEPEGKTREEQAEEGREAVEAAESPEVEAAWDEVDPMKGEAPSS